ncbi:hypothetical protein GCM10009678_27510 [Actinomadura kijaniata]
MGNGGRTSRVTWWEVPVGWGNAERGAVEDGRVAWGGWGGAGVCGGFGGGGRASGLGG